MLYWINLKTTTLEHLFLLQIRSWNQKKCVYKPHHQASNHVEASCVNTNQIKDNEYFGSTCTSHTNQLCGDRLVSVVAINIPMVMANGEECRIYRSGDMMIIHTGHNALKFKSVRFAPDFKMNLMSVSKLDDQAFKVISGDKEVVVTKQNKVYLRAERIGGLYRFQELPNEVAMVAQSASID